MTTPPGLTAAVFDDALREIRAAVGDEWVFTTPADTALYRDAYSLFWDEPEERLASAAVAPATVEQVQAVTRACNARGVPLYPISTGRNLGYGGSAPAYSGSVVLDLKRMDRVIEVDERNGSCIVEPGVSYFDMYRHLQSRGSRLWIDVPDPGWGSMIGNALDFGGGYTANPYRNHFEAHCGMEVVLADGEILRTGMGALPGAQTWQQYRYGFGPYLDGLFKQSTLGITTKMGFWLFPQPEAYFTASINLPRYDDLPMLVDTIGELENANIFNGMPGISSPVLFRGGKNPLDFPEIPEGAEMDRLARETGLPCWSARLTFYGPEQVIRAQWAYAKSRFPTASFTEHALVKLPLSPADMERIHKPSFGIPSLEMFAMGARSAHNPNPTDGHFWFSPIIPRTGEGFIAANRIIRQTCQRLDIPVLLFSPPVSSWWRAFILVMAIPVHKDPARNQHLRAAVKELIRVCADHGWGEYRTAPAFHDAVMDTYSYNNHIVRRVNERIKDALDPNGILSVGRYGVWPKRLREQGGRK
ncbi:FAD-binding protein [Novosphingobium sp. FSY-8]|uniref:FAD-binding protein n=1 Tax=Novosphingobium ovatum TaxID=1908523 RepID=A0ABW9XAS5_9SPHN|nr:FAD-binding oxidoreductase [Novosphingobium ovatum]NBC35646.1 FAD-binding protein [Novosphingobium ovatum]